jgi:hypothetical protein
MPFADIYLKINFKLLTCIRLRLRQITPHIIKKKNNVSNLRIK